MAECVPMAESSDLLDAALVCNNFGECGHRVGPSQPMLCDCCATAEELPTVKIRYAEAKPWEPPPHYKEGQCRCSCHDEKILHITACCDQTYVPRAEMKPHAPRPEPVIGDFSKFTMPVVRKTMPIIRNEDRGGE
jgi:hypothetical protein